MTGDYHDKMTAVTAKGTVFPKYSLKRELLPFIVAS